MATNYSSHGAGSRRTRPSIETAAVLLGIRLLGILIAMHLVAAGVAHVLSSPDAIAAVAMDISTAPVSAPTASTSPASASESPPSDSLGEEAERTDGSRECRPGAAIDSNATFD